jgi:hypothetical protein
LPPSLPLSRYFLAAYAADAPTLRKAINRINSVNATISAFFTSASAKMLHECRTQLWNDLEFHKNTAQSPENDFAANALREGLP